MANENRDILAGDRNTFAMYGVDIKNEELRAEYFDQLDFWHKRGGNGPMPDWLIFPLAYKHRKLPEAQAKKKAG